MIMAPKHCLTGAALALGLGLSTTAASAAPLSATAIEAQPPSTDLVTVGWRRERDYGRHEHRRSSRYVEAPYTDVDIDRGRVDVEAPFTHVHRSRRGVHVRAPFVDIYIPR